VSTRPWLRSTVVVLAITASSLPLTGAARSEPGATAPARSRTSRPASPASPTWTTGKAESRRRSGSTHGARERRPRSAGTRWAPRRPSPAPRRSPKGWAPTRSRPRAPISRTTSGSSACPARRSTPWRRSRSTPSARATPYCCASASAACRPGWTASWRSAWPAGRSGTSPRRCRATRRRRRPPRSPRSRLWRSRPGTAASSWPRPSPSRSARWPYRHPTVCTATPRRGVRHRAANDIDAARSGQPVRHAQPHARLVLPPRLHREDLEHAGRQRTAAGSAATPSRATPRPAGSPAGRRTSRPAQRQPDHPAGRRAADHEHVPVAADRRLVLPAVRRRRLRHVGDRARVHPRHHQPHDRRPDRGLAPAAGRRDEREHSDLMAMEYLYENGYAPRGDTPYVTGGYVTGDPKAPASATTT
jgi:hypothetical protein